MTQIPDKKIRWIYRNDLPAVVVHEHTQQQHGFNAFHTYLFRPVNGHTVNQPAGLHPATSDSGLGVCSGDMLLQSLAACAGVTLYAVATAQAINTGNFINHAEGDLDFRGTLGISKDVPVWFQNIRFRLNLELKSRKIKQKPSSD